MAESTQRLTRGHKKRERTRAQLLEAAAEVLADDGASFTLSEVAARAGVSHGTIYNYFADREELLDALFPELAASFGLAAMVETDITDPALRFAVISTRVLRYAADRPNAMRAMLRFEGLRAVTEHPDATSHLAADLAAGHESGRLIAPPGDATIDGIIGVLAMAANRVVDRGVDRDYHIEIVALLLRSLGVSPAEAGGLAQEAYGLADA